MVWEPGDEAWENKLAALRSYRRANGHLAPRQDAVWGEGKGDGEQLAIGQLLANLRRRGGLGKDPGRAARRAQQLVAIDADWNCPWPLDWQRHYRVLADLVDADGVLPHIDPGVTFDGDDIGRWLQQQRKPGTWRLLSSEQQERLSTLGVQPTEATSPPRWLRGRRRDRAGRSRRSSGAWRLSHSGWNGKANGLCRGGRPRKSRSTARLSQWSSSSAYGSPTPKLDATNSPRNSSTPSGSSAWSGHNRRGCRSASRVLGADHPAQAGPGSNQVFFEGGDACAGRSVL